MARPRKEGLDYFPFDVNLDYKWEAVEAVHGLEGFAICVKLIQECYKEAHGEIDYSDILRRKTIEKRLNCGEELLNNVIETAVRIELFDKISWNDGQKLTSKGIKKRIDAVSKERKSARVRAERSSSDEKHPNKRRKTSKVKKRKEEESIENKIKAGKNIPPTLEQVKQYISEKQKNVDPEQWWNHYNANGWMRGKSKMKNWHSAVATWDNKNKQQYNNSKPTSRQLQAQKEYKENVSLKELMLFKD